MNRASVTDLRKALQCAKFYADHGVLFVPVPVLSEAEYHELHKRSTANLEKMMQEVDDDQS